MGVKALRVQDLRLDYDNSQVYVSCTLLDRSPDEGTLMFKQDSVLKTISYMTYRLEIHII